MDREQLRRTGVNVLNFGFNTAIAPLVMEERLRRESVQKNPNAGRWKDIAVTALYFGIGPASTALILACGLPWGNPLQLDPTQFVVGSYILEGTIVAGSTYI